MGRPRFDPAFGIGLNFPGEIPGGWAVLSPSGAGNFALPNQFVLIRIV